MTAMILIANHSFNDFSEDDVVSIQPADGSKADVELGSGSIGLQHMGHAHKTCFQMSVYNRLIGQTSSIDGPT